MSDENKLPTIGEWISDWLGVELPTLRLPQTIKNLDKAIGKVVLASGENMEARIKGNTKRVKAKSDIVVDGMFRTADDERKLRNRAETTKKAIEELDHDPPSQDAKEEISDDWLNLYSRIAEDKSSAELQDLFGRILAGEIRRPGSFSLRTIQMLSTVSRADAEAISTYLRLVVDKRIVPLFDSKTPYAVQMLMNELGVAGAPSAYVGASVDYTLEAMEERLLELSEFGVLVQNKSSRKIFMQITGQMLTTMGQELLNIARPGPVDMNFLRELTNSIHGKLSKRHSKEVNEGKVVVLAVQLVKGASEAMDYRTLGEAPIENELTPLKAVF